MSFLASNATAEHDRSGRRTVTAVLITASLMLTGVSLLITLDVLTARSPAAEGSALYYGPLLAGPALPGAVTACVAAMLRRREPTAALWCALTAVPLSLGATAWASLLT